MRFGKLEINPAKNPGILDTATWDAASAWAVAQSLDDAYWQALQKAAARNVPLPTHANFVPHAPSCARHQDALYGLASLGDGQQVFVELKSNSNASILGAPLGVKSLADGERLALYKTDADVIDRFCRLIKPDQGPRALGAIPRLGVGTRMTMAVFPAIWKAMDKIGFAANAIQNSVRELYVLEQLLEGQPPERNIAFNFGAIESGYTGSTFEGLWVAGVLDALTRGAPVSYGADADHIQVKRGAQGLARAKRLCTAARYYSFFTLDVSDVLDYRALSTAAASPTEYLDANIPDPLHRRAVLAFHRQPRRFGSDVYEPDADTLGKLIGKYWDALHAVEELYQHLQHLKASVPFDLELSIDEHPPEIATFECLTSQDELSFLLLEMQRRGIPLTHIAPNLGIEKGTDYCCPDGLPGLEARTQPLSQLTQEMGVMLDVHSGDDLSQATRRVIRRATGGRNHFKISPILQLLFAEVLRDYHPELFHRWWQDAFAYAQREAAAGAAFAAACLDAYATAGDSTPSPRDSTFHHFSFAFVGRRDAAGQFLYREEFYDLSPVFYQAYQERVCDYLGGLAAELF